MTTEIALSAPVNLRDLGGIPIDGGVMASGVAIRTDDLAYVTEEVAGALVDEGLTAIIDLRSPFEVGTTGRGPLGSRAVAYHHLPLIANLGSSLGDADLSHAGMARMYVGFVDGSAPMLVTALNVIAYTPGTAAFHCAAGRDRTGVLAAMLLLTLGASDEAIVTDYARTDENMAAIMSRTRPLVGAMWAALGRDERDLDSHRALMDGAMAESMRILLGTLRERHGDALAPLRAAGLSGDTVARLRARALGR